jgi:1-acyl-sn-glycerol-3-phosphate acyltransferase
VSAFAFWKTILFLIPVISVLTAVLGTVALTSGLFDRSGRFAHSCARVWSRVVLFVSGTYVEVRGTLPPRGAYVYAANHQSIYDIPILFWSIPRQLRIIAKASLGWIPFLGWHLHLAGHLLVDRAKPGVGIIKKMHALVSEGTSLIVFPEGTRSSDGSVGRFKGGVFLLAIEHGLPIVPVSVKGSREVMLKGRLMVKPGRVVVTIHEPVSTEGLVRDDARALGERVRAIVEQAAG